MITTRWKCKTTMSTSPSRGRGVCLTKQDGHPVTWCQVFIVDNWYDIIYEPFKGEMAKWNGLYRKVWAINESGEKVEISRSQIKVLFHIDNSELRDSQIKDILL